jgi:hypothetical protein
MLGEKLVDLRLSPACATRARKQGMDRAIPVDDLGDPPSDRL